MGWTWSDEVRSTLNSGVSTGQRGSIATASGRVRLRAESESPRYSTRTVLALHWGTFHRTIRTKDAAIAGFGAKHRLAASAFVEELAGVSWHRFAFGEAANRAYQHRFKKKVAHARLSTPSETSIASWLSARLLFYSQNRVLCRLGDSEFDDGLGWNLDLLLRLRIKAERAFLFCFKSLPKPGKTNSPLFLISLYARALSVSRNTPAVLLLVSVAAASAI